MTEAIQNRGNTLVVTGAFAPAMFHPSWFERYDLLGKNEVSAAASSANLLVSEEISLFKVAGFDFDIRPNRMQIGTTQESLFEATRDLMCSLLEVIDGAPVQQIGINWTAHYSTASSQAWHKAGDVLVPKIFWSTIWPKHVGMSNLALQLERQDDKKGHINMTFQPSPVIPNGVFLAVNDHYELKDDKAVFSGDAAKQLRSLWAQSKEMADKLIGDVYQETTK